MEDELDIIRTILNAARAALQSELVKNSLVTLNHFPYGSCADASLLTGNILLSLGLPDFHVVYGEVEDENRKGPVPKTHAWLESDRYLIDITADQFPGHSDYLFITKPTVAIAHLGFTPVSSGKLDLQFTAIAWPSFKAAFDAIFFS